MDDGIPTQTPKHFEAPSLAERLSALARSTPSLRGWRPLGFAPLGLFAGSVAILAVWAWLSAAELRRRTTSLQPSVAAAAVAREQQSELGRLFADPSVAATLQLLRQKLPADLRVVSALGAGEHLTITLEAADPDALRRLLRAEPWFAGFRERGQAMGRDGSIRVTFERSE